jgi:hypothetical protein
MTHNQEMTTVTANDKALVEMLRATNDPNNLEALFTALQPSDPVESLVRRC